MLFSLPYLTVFKKPTQFKRRHIRRKHRSFCSVRENSRNGATAPAGRDVLPNSGHLCTMPVLMPSPARQDLPLSAISHPRFPREGVCPKPRPHRALPPQQPDLPWNLALQGLLPPEHSSSYLVMIKILRGCQVFRKMCIQSPEDWVFISPINLTWPLRRHTLSGAGPQLWFYVRGKCLTWIKLARFYSNQIWT